MQPPRPEAPFIFVKLDSRTPPWLVVSGKTWNRNRDLGFEGLGIKWNSKKKAWEKLWSLRDYEILESWPEVGISPEARDKARLQQIGENRRRREAEMEARRARGEFKDMDEKIALWAKQA